MNNIDIAKVAHILSDDALYPVVKGVKRQDSPSFIFFDDENEVDSDLRKFREDLLDFEEWHAARKRYNEYEVAPEAMAYQDRQDSRKKANWLIGWHKRRTANNDHWRQLMMPIIKKFDDPEIGDNCKLIYKTIASYLPEAPRPIGGTIFVNPDGSKHETAGTGIGAARVSYQRRHKIKNEEISVERVQKAGHRSSMIVVGTRKASDKAVSQYYDENPKWNEKVVDGQWVKAYLPSATNLTRIRGAAGEAMVNAGVMPPGSHRLSVREFEQCIIAGAETFDSDEEAMAYQIEKDPIVDDRTSVMDQGYGANGRDISALDEQDAYLYGILKRAGHDQACELLMLRDQDPRALYDYFYDGDNPTKIEDIEWAHTELAEVLQMVEDDDLWKVKTNQIELDEQALPNIFRALAIEPAFKFK
tara:strand:+ start:2661 stop:3908 length:1248 start_codon:yes stop_codon:yes gene_type:complete